jgi:probable phosphoglycerate mutase
LDSATQLLVLRHGETAWNAEQRIQGQLDTPLNDTGRWQAERLGQALSDAGVQAIYSSDLQRARDTAAPLARLTGLAVREDPQLRERHFGQWQGELHDDIVQRWPAAAQAWRQRDPDFAPPGGETLAAFHARAVAAYAAIARAHPGQCVAVFAHGGLLDSLYRAATGVALQSPRSWLCANARINRVLYHAEGYAGAGFTLVGWNDDAHLLVDDRGGDGLRSDDIDETRLPAG